MIREMLGIAEGILQDLHNDHSEVASLMNRIEENATASQTASVTCFVVALPPEVRRV